MTMFSVTSRRNMPYTVNLAVVTGLNAILLLGALLLAIWLRVYLPLGNELGVDYITWLVEFPLLIGSLSIVATGLAVLATRHAGLARIINPQRQFRVLLIASGLVAGVVLIFLPDISQLLVIYFVLSALILGLMNVVLPGRLRQSANVQVNVLDDLRDLYRKRTLLILWLRYRIESRYALTFLGIFWIVLLPLSNALVRGFAYEFLLGAGSPTEGISMLSFLLSGIAVFGIFQELVTKAKQSIVSAGSLLRRVHFPREIIIILILGETLVDFVFVLSVLIIVNITQGIYPSWHFTLLLVPITIMTALSLGLAFALSWLSLIIRDLQQLIMVVMQLLFYTTILYSSERIVSPILSFILNLIPLTAIINAFRDIVLHNKVPDFASLAYPTVFSFALLYLGYVYFKVNEDRFADFL